MSDSRDATATLSLSAPSSEIRTEPPVFLREEVVAQRFRIVRPLGAGGMGQVFEAEDLELGTRVALKVIRPRATRSPEAETLLRREVHLARRVTHPNVCRIFDLVVHHPGRDETAWGHEGRPILGLTMELLTGETLEDRLRERGPLPPRDAVELLRPLAAALDAAHDVGVYHCDLKPSNVILTPSRVVVTDFGLARCAWTNEDRADSPLRGTPGYLAPEILAGGRPAAAADRYALGVIAHRMLLGRLPADETPDENPAPETSRLPRQVRTALARAIHPDPQARYPKADAFVDALAAALPARPFGRWPWLAAALLTFVLLSLGAVEWQSSFRNSAVETHLDTARHALQEVDYSRGRAAAQRAVVAARVTSEPEAEAQAQLFLAEALEAMGRPAEADEAMGRAVQLLETAGDRCGLARAGLVFRDTTDVERAPLPLEELPPILEACGDSVHHAIALARLAKRRMQTDMAEGERMLQDALALAEETGEPRALAEVWNAFGSLHYGREDLHASESAFARAVAEARRAEDPYLVAGMLLNHSSLLGWLGRPDRALATLEEAVTLARRIGNRYLLQRALRMDAGRHTQKGHFDKAQARLEEIYRLSLELGDPLDIRLSLGQLALLSDRKGNWETALHWLHKIDELPTAHSPSPVQEARHRLSLARLHRKLDETKQAKALVTAVMDAYPLEDDADSTALYSRFERVLLYLEDDELEAAADLFRQMLPYLVHKDEVGLRRDAAHLAVELDRRLEPPRLVSAWQRLATSAPVAASASDDTLEHALQLRADLGRLRWFAGDRTGAEQQFQAVSRRARDLGRRHLVAQLKGERQALERWKDYWRWAS